MTCREFVDFLMAYLDGELTSDSRATFEEHTRDCPPCVEYLNTYRETIRMGKMACKDDAGAPPGDVPERLIEAILSAKQRG